jgi:transcriptional regulator with XRE-family HTH domain
MTFRGSSEASMFEQRQASGAGAQGLSAARFALQVIRLFFSAKKESGLSHREIASRLEITEGRVSQVLNGDGNVHVATLARFMHAMGYDLSLRAIPFADGREPLEITSRRERKRRGHEQGRQDFDVYKQVFLTSDGVMQVPMFVPTDDVLGCVPHGAPTFAGRVRVAALRRSHASQRARTAGNNWQTTTKTVELSA